jgi:hypothetical protein
LTVQSQSCTTTAIQSVTLPASSLLGNQQILLPPVRKKFTKQSEYFPFACHQLCFYSDN